MNRGFKKWVASKKIVSHIDYLLFSFLEFPVQIKKVGKIHAN